MEQGGWCDIVMIWRICCIRQWMEKRCVGHASMPKRNAHLLSLYECESGIVIAQEAVKNKDIRDFCSDLITKLKPLNKSSPSQTASTQQLPPVSPSGQIPTAPVMSSQPEQEDIPDTLNKH